MKKKVLIFSILALVATAGVIGTLSMAQAFGGGFGMRGIDVTPEQIVDRQIQMFGHQAEMLGVSVDQIKEYWSRGKNMGEIMEELNINQEDVQTRMRTEREARMKTELQALVENGVITQAQADARLENAKSRGSEFGGRMMGKRGGGMRGGCPSANAPTSDNNK